MSHINLTIGKQIEVIGICFFHFPELAEFEFDALPVLILF